MPPESVPVVVDTVVGDLDVVSPAVHEDAAAALGTVGDAQAVDARRVAHRSCWGTDYARVPRLCNCCRKGVVPSGNEATVAALVRTDRLQSAG